METLHDALVDTYVYEPLQSHEHIRLVRISKPRLWSTKRTSSLGLEIVQARLPANAPIAYAKKLKYECLSYAWGQQERTCKLRLSDYQGVVLVTPSLYDTIARVAAESSTGLLWVDQVCINQENGAERGHQCSRMHDIYRLSIRTIVCLGPDIPGLRKATRLRRWTRQASVSRSDDSLEAFAALFARMWFARGWVVQEYVLPRRVDFLAGKVCLPSATLRAMAGILDSIDEANPDTMDTKRSSKMSTSTVRREYHAGTTSLLVMQSLRERFCTELIAFEMPRRTPKHHRRHWQSKLQQLCICARNFATTDHRDRIVAFLGLLGGLDFSPDYTRTPRGLAKDFLTAIIEKTHRCDFLMHAHCHGDSIYHDHAWPSWLPPWTRPPSPTKQPDMHPETVQTHHCEFGAGSKGEPAWMTWGSPSLCWQADGQSTSEAPETRPKIVDEDHLAVYGYRLGLITEYIGRAGTAWDKLNHSDPDFWEDRNDLLPPQKQSDTSSEHGHEHCKISKQTLTRPQLSQLILSTLSTSSQDTISDSKQSSDNNNDPSTHAHFPSHLAALRNKHLFATDATGSAQRRGGGGGGGGEGFSVGIAAERCESGDVLAVVIGCCQPVILREEVGGGAEGGGDWDGDWNECGDRDRGGSGVGNREDYCGDGNGVQGDRRRDYVLGRDSKGMKRYRVVSTAFLAEAMRGQMVAWPGQKAERLVLI